MNEPQHHRSWTVPVSVAELPKDGAHFDLAASEPVRTAVAREAGLVALPRLEAAFDVRRKGESVAVSGRLSATVVQTCVVTLDPVTAEVDEAVDLVFAPPEEGEAGHADADSIDAADPPEPLTAGSIDLGAVAVEALLLGLDPYPRKPDAVFEAPAAGAQDDGPFAALAALRGRSKAEG